jgi:hypothetical protein
MYMDGRRRQTKYVVAVSFVCGWYVSTHGNSALAVFYDEPTSSGLRKWEFVWFFFNVQIWRGAEMINFSRLYDDRNGCVVLRFVC